MIRAVAAVMVLCLGMASGAQARAPKVHIVQVVSDYDNFRMYFQPKTIIIEPGDTVTWVNLVNEDHNVLSYPDGYPEGAKPLSSPFLKKKNETWSHTFSVKGTYEYHCLPHLPMGMRGTIIVSRPSPDREFHVPSAAEVKKYVARLREFFDDDEFKYKPRRQRHSASRGLQGHNQ